MDTLFIDYLVAKRLSDQTITLYTIYLKKLEAVMEGSDISEINQEVVNVFLSAYPHSVTRALIKNYLRYKKIGDIEVPDATGRKEKKVIQTISETHLNILREYFYNKRIDLGLIFDLSYYGALRRAEVVKIRLCDINIDELASDTNEPVKVLIRGKGKKERIVIIPKLLLKTIILYASEKGYTKDERIFKMRGKRWWEFFHKGCLDLGMMKIERGKVVALYHPHCLRHSMATEWLDKGVSIVKISKRLGHSRLDTTQVYIHPDKKKLEEEWGKEYD